MQLAKRHDIRTEAFQAGAFVLLVAFIYHYFGPSAATPPGPQVFGILTICVLLFVSTVNRPGLLRIRRRDALETLSQEQTNKLTETLRQADWLQLDRIMGGIYARLGCVTSAHSNGEGENNFSLVIERAGQKTAVMCKPWKSSEVTSPEIIEFSTELKQAGMTHGLFVTLRECTAPALKVAETLGIDVVNEDGLLQLLAAAGEDHRAQLLSAIEEGQKRCPSCARQMVLRQATQGLGAGEQFWECSDFPQCRCTEPR